MSAKCQSETPAPAANDAGAPLVVGVGCKAAASRPCAKLGNNRGRQLGRASCASSLENHRGGRVMAFGFTPREVTALVFVWLTKGTLILAGSFEPASSLGKPRVGFGVGTL
jgi:hypothetical protein